MKPIWIAALLGVAVVAGVGAVAAQSSKRVHAPVVARGLDARTSVATLDQFNLVDTRLTRLEHRVHALEATLGKTQPSVTYRCADPTTSVNSLGVADACSPYGCNQETGLCRDTARTSNDCATGFYWDGQGRCVPPAPSNPGD